MMGTIRTITYYTLLTIAVFALSFAIASRINIACCGVFNIPYALQLEVMICASSIIIIFLFCKKHVNENSAQIIILTIGLAMVVTFIGIMLSDNISSVVGKWFGTKEKKTETLQLLGWIISGVIAFFGLFAINKRATSQDKNNALTEKGLSQERFNTAVDHLFTNSTLKHKAAFHALLYLAKAKEDSYAQGALGILCEHLRQISNAKFKQEISESHTLVDMLFSSETVGISDKLRYDLQRVKLLKVDFRKMHKPKGEVDFSDADLSEAVFNNTDLSGFIFRNATLHKTKFESADLQKAILFDADLSGANLSDANLSNANLSNAKLLKADLSNANLLEADLFDAKLNDANLFEANLSSVDLSNANLSGANLRGANLSSADLFITNLSGADLCGARLHKAKGLESATLSEAKYDDKTTFPNGFSKMEQMEKMERPYSEHSKADS